MKSSRMNNSLKNSAISLASYFLTVLLRFANRSIFVHFLSADYLGLNGLFSNIISFLSLAELGIGTAITYSLYKPLESDDKESVKSIMSLYKKMYTLIGIFVIVVGFVLSPFLPYLIKDMPNIPNIKLYYCAYVLNSGVSYFLTYKRTIIICDQKQYISSLTTTLKEVLLNTVQILVLMLTRNYLLYLVVLILSTIIENILISRICDKLYPYLKEQNIQQLNSEIKNGITKNVSAMFFHKIGSMIVFSTDNLIISKCVGLASVGIYSNYVLITNTLGNILNQIFTSVTASVGNLIAADDKKHSLRIFKYLFFINFWFFYFSSICLFVLFNPFINIWIGEGYTFPLITVFIITVNFYFGGMRKSVGIFKDAGGLFWEDRYKPLAESLVNLVFSIPLALKYGVAGTILGTIITTLVVSIPTEAYVLFKKYFSQSLSHYFFTQLKYFSFTIVVGLMTYGICLPFYKFGIIGFIICMAICTLFPNIVFILMYRKKEEFHYFCNVLVDKFGKFLRRSK